MRFSVVEIGYDQRQVDSCLDDLGARLTELAARTAGATVVGGRWEQIRDELIRLRALVDERRAGPGRVPRPGEGDPEAAAVLARARAELDAAREEARQLREQVYAEAVQARRNFEAALYARRRREERADEILSGVLVTPVPADTPTAAAALTANGVPATRPAVPPTQDPAADPSAPSARGGGSPVR